MSETLYRSVGGVPYQPRLRQSLAAMGTENVWNFGWVPMEDRTPEEQAIHEASVAAMPKFAIQGSYDDTIKKVCLTDLWSNPTTVKALGFAFTGIRQITGSCIGAGGGTCKTSLILSEIIGKRDVERIVIPFWLLPYGRSRMRGGMRGRGEGSFGSTFADAARLDGWLEADTSGLPEFQKMGDGFITWGESAEYQWSAGEQISSSWLEKAKVYLTGTTARAQSPDDIRAGLLNGYPSTIASSWGCQSGPRVEGSPSVLLGRRSGSWGHQMSIHAWWEHPSLGELFWIHNQWGDYCGRCPTGMPAGGFWVLRSEVDWICRTGEAFVFSNFANGFPARSLDWLI